MFEFIIVIFIIYIVFKKSVQSQSIASAKLNALFKAQNFHSITKDLSIPGITLTSASSHGENYLLAQKNNMVQFSTMDIDNIYEKAQKLHIHNIVVLTPSHTSFSNHLLEKIKNYDIKILDDNKINSLIASSNSTSVLSTSDTSDDKCKIDSNSFEPIYEPTSFWKKFFTKPDRL